MKTLGKVLFVLGVIQCIISYILGCEYFINLFSVIGIISLAVALVIALAEKKIWLHAIVTLAIVGSCLFSYIIGFFLIYHIMLIVFVGYMLALVFVRVRENKWKGNKL